MQTAIISDLHLGSLSGRDILRDPTFRDILLEEIGKADQVVLLGDLLELFERPLQEALEQARPFLEELGRAVAGRPVLLVPGNHDHRLAKPVLDQVAVESGPLGLEHRARPTSEETERLATWLGAAKLELSYPGIWLRDDVYATHGHYMDCYRRLPRLECVAAATVMRTRPLPDRPTPQDYERVLTPVYSLAFGLAQARLAHRVTRRSERLWSAMSNGKPGKERKAGSAALRSGTSAGVWFLNRLLRSDLNADLTPDALSETGIAAATKLAQRLEVEVAHMITGHTHRAGPAGEEPPWPLTGGGHLHNSGSWILTQAFQDLDGQAAVYQPGTVTWLAKSGPPYRTYPLAGHSGEELRSAADRLALEGL
jgi:UDP-2,3-diacylglucosamine pyrophosphatase LpxH